MEAKVELDATQAGPQKIVYVKPVPVTDLPAEVQSQAMGATSVYAVHSETGERLAIVRDQSLAFMLARQNDMAPVLVH